MTGIAFDEVDPSTATSRARAAFFFAVFSDVFRCFFWNSTQYSQTIFTPPEQEGEMEPCQAKGDGGFSGRARPDDLLTRQEPIPAFIRQLRILRQFPPNHELFDPVYRMYVVHAVDNDTADLLETLV